MNRASSPTGWVRNPDGTLGWTCNPLTGCRNCTPAGLCLGGGFPCYAWKVANGRLKPLYLANVNYPEQERYQRVPFYPRFWNERLKELTRRNDMLWVDDIERTRARPKNTKPIGIFLCDMGDLFGIGVPREWTEKILDEVWDNKGYDRFYVLTKQASRLPEFSPFPENCWVGVTATSIKMFVDACNNLLHVKAKVIYLSLEPLLEWDIDPDILYQDLTAQQINWVIIGACTGTLNELKPLALKYPELSLMPYGVHDPELPFTRGKKWTLQPKTEWVQKIALACTKTHISLFLKDNLRPLLPNRMPFYDVVSYLSDDKTHTLCENRLRQEMPIEKNPSEGGAQ